MKEPRLYRSGAPGDYLSRWQRILVIDQRLRDGSHPTASGLAAECGVTRRTIVRDLEALRCLAAAPIEYVAARKGYRYGDGAFGIPVPVLSADDLFSLLLARSALARHAGTPFAGSVEGAFERLLHFLPPEPRERIDRVEGIVHFSGLPAPKVDPAACAALLGAIERRERVVLDYRHPGRGEVVPRELDPLAIVVRDVDWFLLARCVRARGSRRGKVFTYYLPRIVAVRPAGVRFDPPPDFSVGAFLRQGFDGMQSTGSRPVRVELRFRPAVAHLADERSWAQGQRLARNRDGSRTVRFTTKALFAVERLVRGYGGEIEVLRPERLRKELAEAGRRLARVHGPSRRRDV